MSVLHSGTSHSLRVLNPHYLTLTLHPSLSLTLQPSPSLFTPLPHSSLLTLYPSLFTSLQPSLLTTFTPHSFPSLYTPHSSYSLFTPHSHSSLFTLTPYHLCSSLLTLTSHCHTSPSPRWMTTKCLKSATPSTSALRPGYPQPQRLSSSRGSYLPITWGYL